MDGEVPWNNAHDDTEGSEALDGLLLVIFLDDLFLKLVLCEGPQPSETSTDLTNSELVLLRSAYIQYKSTPHIQAFPAPASRASQTVE